jgi:hypothetical protein
VIRAAHYNAIPVVKALPQRQAINGAVNQMRQHWGELSIFVVGPPRKGGHIFSGSSL